MENIGLSARDGRLRSKTYFQITIMLLPISVTTCSAVRCIWSVTAPIGSWTVETVARHNGKLLQELPLVKLSA